jgi:hypothetical protein
MNTKSQVISKAKKLNCSLDISSYEVALHAPKGKLLNGELHISVYDIGTYTKSEIWSNLISDMSFVTDCNGSSYCTCEVA